MTYKNPSASFPNKKNGSAYPSRLIIFTSDELAKEYFDIFNKRCNSYFIEVKCFADHRKLAAKIEDFKSLVANREIQRTSVDLANEYWFVCTELCEKYFQVESKNDILIQLKDFSASQNVAVNLCGTAPHHFAWYLAHFLGTISDAVKISPKLDSIVAEYANNPRKSIDDALKYFYEKQHEYSKRYKLIDYYEGILCEELITHKSILNAIKITKKYRNPHTSKLLSEIDTLFDACSKYFVKKQCSTTLNTVLVQYDHAHPLEKI